MLITKRRLGTGLLATAAMLLATLTAPSTPAQAHDTEVVSTFSCSFTGFHACTSGGVQGQGGVAHAVAFHCVRWHGADGFTRYQLADGTQGTVAHAGAKDTCRAQVVGAAGNPIVSFQPCGRASVVSPFLCAGWASA